MADRFTGLDDPRIVRAKEAFDRTGNISEAARILETSRASVGRALNFIKKHEKKDLGSFDVEPLPEELPSAEELVERRKAEYQRKKDFEEATKLINVRVKIPGVYGVVHCGDPHLDDAGSDLESVERIIHAVQTAPDGALFAASVGDLQNNWIGRLSHLFGQQNTTAAEAWVLVEWFINSMPWLYLVGGNHDAWSGAGDPLKWMMRQRGVYQYHGVRLNLISPDKRQIRINARHDWHQGHSQWNTAHSLVKGIMMGFRDHIVTAGHSHVSGYQLVKDPSSGLISHAIRVGSFKKYDNYAKEKGLPNQNISPAVVTIIDPQYADDDPRLITVFHSGEEGAEFLEWKRRKK